MKNKIYKFWAPNMKWGNFVTYSSEHEKEKGGILTTSGDKYGLGGQKLTPGMWLESATL